MYSSQLADRAGVNSQTLRYYERRGLLPTPGRTQAGYRSWDEHAVATVCFVKAAQRLGFRLGEIRDLLHLAAGGPDNCENARRMATGKIAELDAKIADLSAMREALVGLAATCQKAPQARVCPLLDTIGQEGQR